MRLTVNSGTSRLLDFFEDDVYYFFVTELESGGSLGKYLKEVKNNISEERAREISHHVAQTIDDFHEYGLVIGQIDIDSIIMSDKGHNGVPRLSKFDFAQILYPGNTIKDYGSDV